jgi:hypothetical protein
MGECDARFLLKRFQLSHVYLSVLIVLCALIKYVLNFPAASLLDSCFSHVMKNVHYPRLP